MDTNERKIITADPSAIGLFGLAMVTLVAASQKLGWTSGTSFIIPWCMFLGASAQLFACISDAKKNNVFGTTAFGAFAFFWYSVGMTWMIQLGVFGEAMAANADVKQLGFAFLGYLIFCLFMTFAALETSKFLFIIFIFIDLLFIGLTGSVLFGIHEFHILAAWSELIIAILGFYGSGAHVINATFGKTFLPLGKPFGIFKKAAPSVNKAA